jgi:hypothetical protein
MFTFSTFLLLLLRFAITAAVMFFAFNYGLLIGTVVLWIWWMLEGIFVTERVVRWLREPRPETGVDREVYNKMLAFKDRSFWSIFSEQFLAQATVVVIYCLVGWKLDISPVYVILAYVGADLITWPYSLSRIRQVATEVAEKQEEHNSIKAISEQILEQVGEKYRPISKYIDINGE